MPGWCLLWEPDSAVVWGTNCNQKQNSSLLVVLKRYGEVSNHKLWKDDKLRRTHHFRMQKCWRKPLSEKKWFLLVQSVTKQSRLSDLHWNREVHGVLYLQQAENLCIFDMSNTETNCSIHVHLGEGHVWELKILRSREFRLFKHV